MTSDKEYRQFLLDDERRRDRMIDGMNAKADAEERQRLAIQELGLTRDELLDAAEALLTRKSSGDNPGPQTSRWSLRIAAGMCVLRGLVREALRSVDEGHMTINYASEILEICDRGLQAFLDLDK